jgi:CubicO group peptidase (beta-lactamase class C family)
VKGLQKMILGIIIILVILGIGLYAFAPHSPATPKQVRDQAELETYLNRLVASGNPPGLSVVVVKDGQMIYNRAFGLSDTPRQMAATPETVYHWWSMTKIPTAIAILQLQEKGLLNLDDSVVQHLPWFEVVYPSAGSQPALAPVITLRHLLQHSSGLPDAIPAIFGWVHSDDAGRNQTELVRKFLPQYNKLKSIPGEKAAYTNWGYLVLGAVIEAVSGQSYESYITENILQPLSMSQTGFVYSPAMAAHEAMGSLPVVHVYTPMLPFLVDTKTLIREWQGQFFWFNRIYIDVTPSTGLIGSAPDVARLMLAYLNGGTLDGASILTPESVALMTNTPPVDQVCGLGWHMGQGPADARYIEHTGGGPGFATLMRLYPEKNLGVALLANGTNLDYAGLANLLASLDW